MSVWTVEEASVLNPDFDYRRSIMIRAVLRMCTTDADLFMANLRDRVFDLDEVIYMGHPDAHPMVSLCMYMMISGHPYTNLAPHVIRQGCALDMNRFFREPHFGFRVNPMGYAILHDQVDAVLAMMERGFSCTEPCAYTDTQGSHMDAVQLAIGARDRDGSRMTIRILDAANLMATQLTKYLRVLTPSDVICARVINRAIDIARARQPYYGVAWLSRNIAVWRDVMRGCVMPAMQTDIMGATITPKHWDPNSATALLDIQHELKRGDRDDDDEGEHVVRPNKLRKV